MGITSLDSALSGLRAAQQQLSAISANVANVSTPGYSRKILPQYTQVVDGSAVGVVGGTLTRNVDINLTRDLWTQVSETKFLNIQQSYLQRVEQFHGPPDSNISIASKVLELKDSFAALANTPEDAFLQAAAVSQATTMANKMNEFSDLITTARNDIQGDIEVTVSAINDLLVQIADLNAQARRNTAGGRTTAQIEDERDKAIKELSGFIGLSTFTRGDGVLVVQTTRGEELAAEEAQKLYFNATPLAATVSYPDSSNPTANGIYVRNPATDNSALDITQLNVGGTLGGLIELRDTVFPQQMAQLDEIAHKMALRFDAQGLLLFTDSSGTLPPDTPPDTTTNPPTRVPYVGFASNIRVNQAVLDDNSLVQQGTYGGSLSSGSNELLRRIVEFTFGNVSYQQAVNPTLANAVDLANAADPLQEWLGLPASNTVTNTRDLTAYASVNDMINTLGTSVFGTVAPAAETDSFDITFSDPSFGGTHTITVDLRDVVAAAPAGANAAEQIVNYIKADASWNGGAPDAVSDFGATVSVDASTGQIVFTSAGNITIAASAGDSMSSEAFSAIGFSATTHEATDPYFDVQVGNNNPVRITITPAMTSAQLLSALNNVPGLVARYDATDGFLEMRAGNSFTDPDFGGDIKLTSGPFVTNGVDSYASPPASGNVRAAVDAGVNVISALFGTYTTGPIVNENAVQSYGYESQISATNTNTVAFRNQYLGPNAGVSADIIGTEKLLDYAQKIVNQQTQKLNLIQSQYEDSETLEDLLNTQLTNESGVNLDEELSYLIIVQTAFTAASRVVSVVDEMFDELMRSI